MTHDCLLAEKICEHLYKHGYTSIKYERCVNDSFQNVVILRACLLHAYGNKKLLQENPQLHIKIKKYIDSINLTYFVKHPKDRIRFGL